MNIIGNSDHDEAQDILDALRKIQDSAEQQATVKTNFATPAIVLVPVSAQKFRQ